MTFQARAVELTNLSYLGIQGAVKKGERGRQTDGQPGATDLYTETGAHRSCRDVMYGWEYRISKRIEAAHSFD